MPLCAQQELRKDAKCRKLLEKLQKKLKLGWVVSVGDPSLTQVTMICLLTILTRKLWEAEAKPVCAVYGLRHVFYVFVEGIVAQNHAPR